MYQIEWDFKIWTELKANHETRSSAPVHEKYVMVLNCNNVTVAQSKTTYFHQRYGGDLLLKVIGERRLSHDLNQGEIQIWLFALIQSNFNSYRCWKDNGRIQKSNKSEQ